jgi:hypothetical protein
LIFEVEYYSQYNHTMGHVDVADQLRGSYRIGTYVRNRKCWWVIMFWAFGGTLLTNAYVVYIKVNIAEGVDQKELLSHYDFCIEIALNWLDSSYETRTNQIKDAPSNKATGLMLLFSSPSSVSTITISSSRAAFCTDSSLSENGLLQCRLYNLLFKSCRIAPQCLRKTKSQQPTRLLFYIIALFTLVHLQICPLRPVPLPQVSLCLYW